MYEFMHPAHTRMLPITKHSLNGCEVTGELVVALALPESSGGQGLQGANNGDVRD